MISVISEVDYLMALNKFMNENTSCNEIDYLNYEISRWQKLKPNDALLPEKIRQKVVEEYGQYLSEKNISDERKNEIIDELVSRKNVGISETGCDNYIEYYKRKLNIISPQEVNEPVFNLNQRLVMLNELGILKYLKDVSPFNTSINALAKLLSSILNEKQVSINPVITAILNNDEDNRHNPYRSEQSTQKVKNYLLQLGFNLSQ